MKVMNINARNSKNNKQSFGSIIYKEEGYDILKEAALDVFRGNATAADKFFSKLLDFHENNLLYHIEISGEKRWYGHIDLKPNFIDCRKNFTMRKEDANKNFIKTLEEYIDYLQLEIKSNINDKVTNNILKAMKKTKTQP